MAKKELKVRNTKSSDRSNRDLPSEYPTVAPEIKSDPRSDLINAGISQYSPDNVPQDWEALKKEILFLETVSIKSDIILGHRLVYVRDHELFKRDGYLTMVDWVEEVLNVSKTKAYFLMSIVDLFPFRPGGIKKVKNLELAMSVIKSHLDKKEEIFDMSQELGKKEFLTYLRVYKQGELEQPTEAREITDDWFNDRQDLLAQSKFLREGMKPKTTTKMLKELVNLKILDEPRNKTLEKIKKLLAEL